MLAPVARGRQGMVLATVLTAGLAVFPAGTGHAADPWLHLSIAPATKHVPPAAPVAMLVPASLPLPTPTDDVPAITAGRSFLTTQSVACLVTGGAATLAALSFGWQNVTNLISGGVVPAAGPGAVALGLFGVVFTSFCAIGQALTPLYLDLVDGGPPRPGAEALSPRVPVPDVSARRAPIRASPPRTSTVSFRGGADCKWTREPQGRLVPAC